ncbi:histidine phosphatase family protein [Amorphus coralli]|uniref:histidine phosphatase family protein n=1 Tax=Amorphus coralli TaxID=340680 RepID=UPI00036DEADA|nr:histidine phosphatase family protein [Amorphus coralli]
MLRGSRPASNLATVPTVKPGQFLIHIRHGQTDWNAEARLQGETDIPINDLGREQARRNGAHLAECLRTLGREPDSFGWVASPLSRARETMEIVRTEMGLPRADYRIEPSLKEISFGSWKGHTIPELKVIDPDAVAERRRDKWGFLPPGGESYAQLKVRIAAWLDTVGDDLIVVSHGGVYRVLHHILAGTPEPDAPGLPTPQDRIAVFRDNGVDLL